MPLAALLACVAFAPPARAERLAYYRVGGGVAFPRIDSASLATGWAFGLGVSVPFAHRLALTADLARQQFGANEGSQDTSIDSALLGVELLPGRGSEVRPLFSAELGAASLDAGERRTEFAAALGAGVRWRLPAHHKALRLQAQWMYVATEPAARTVPVVIALEF